jgi:acyl-CoA synthetase (AMP-forming)/AMP-acid ligase II
VDSWPVVRLAETVALGGWVMSRLVEFPLQDGGAILVQVDEAAAGPDVAEAAVIAVPDPKWAERPLAVVVRKAGSEVSEAELVASIAGRFPKWWLPARVEFVDELPKTATGKFSKRTLRERFVGGVREEEGSDER